MSDLFGNDTPPPLTPEPEPIAVTLFDHVAEHAALKSAKPLSQIRIELMHGDNQTPLLPGDIG